MIKQEELNKDNLEKLNGTFLSFSTIIFLLSFIILIIFYFNFSVIEGFLDKLYISNTKEYVFDNIKYFLFLLFTYFVFLAYIGRKKGKILSSDDYKIGNKYGGALLLGYQFINFFLFVHLKYLIEKNGFDFFIWGQELFLLIFFIINYLLVISDDLFNKLIETKYLKKFYLLFLFILVIVPFFKVGYFEIIIIFYIASIIVPFIHKLNQAYIDNHNKIEFLDLINKYGKKEIKTILTEYFTNIKDETLLSKTNTLYLCFLFLPGIISFSVILSFLIPFIGVIYGFNIFSLIYIHLAFIIIYISLNLISNKFGEYVAVKFNNKEYKGYLLENTKEKIILLGKDNNFVVNKDKVEYIKTIKKR
ncbi:MAG: hypothetical protein PHV23_05345 [Candidatus Gracilibacteria bacterium]|nr:hypothetical protein [Candidatus Gracilibacteria bacterium]